METEFSGIHVGDQKVSDFGNSLFFFSNFFALETELVFQFLNTLKFSENTNFVPIHPIHS